MRQWTVVCVDLEALLLQERGLRPRHVRGLQICANLFVRGVITSDTPLDPSALPRDFTLPLSQVPHSSTHHVHAASRARKVTDRLGSTDGKAC